MTEVLKEHRSGLRFDWVVLRKLVFQDDAPVSADVRLTDLHLDVDIRIWVSDDGKQCRTFLGIKIEPAVGQEPPFSDLYAAVEGQFSVEEGMLPTVSVPDFARQQATAILFPFARQAIATATSSARCGPVLIPPINVVALAAEMTKSPAPPA